jgi:hypothetical protein
MAMDIGSGTVMKVRKIAQWLYACSWVIDWMTDDGRNDGKNDGKYDGNELSPKNMYACPQLDTCHVGSYFGPLVPNFRTKDKIIIHTL